MREQRGQERTEIERKRGIEEERERVRYRDRVRNRQIDRGRQKDRARYWLVGKDIDSTRTQERDKYNERQGRTCSGGVGGRGADWGICPRRW